MFGDLLFMATNCFRTSLCRYFRRGPGRGYSTVAGYNVPKRGDKGKLFTSLTGMLICMNLVVVGMSGGVDSSVTAKLLADQVNQFEYPKRSFK